MIYAKSTTIILHYTKKQHLIIQYEMFTPVYKDLS